MKPKNILIITLGLMTSYGINSTSNIEIEFQLCLNIEIQPSLWLDVN